MAVLNTTQWDERRELTYDFYPNDKRLKKARGPINDQQAIINISYGDDQVGSDRRSLTFDYYPDDRRSS